MDEVRIFGYCAECGEKITDESADYYCNDEGEVFCTIECVMEHYGVHRLEI